MIAPMRIHNKAESLLLLVGDILLFYATLWLTLLLRHVAVPSRELFLRHAEPFSYLFIAWVIIFFIAGLYEKHTLVLKKRLPSRILNAQVVNVILAALFFFTIPYFGITPKTVLFIYLVVSTGLVWLWRMYGPRLFRARTTVNGLLIGSGEEMKELQEEINKNERYGLHFVSAIDLKKIEGIDFHREVLNRVYSEDISLIVIDIRDGAVEPILPHLYNLIFSGVHFVDMYKLYEEIFDRVPISLVHYNWFLEHLSLHPKVMYDVFKRGMDIVFALVLGILSLLLYPFVALAIKLEDGGPVFYVHDRLGENNRIVNLVKFRSMRNIDSGKDALESTAVITKVGRFIRKTRIDELPQLWNILKGDLSLIGPRPEIPELARRYEEEVPYYNVRHLIKPGISGWAQVYQDAGEIPKFGTRAEATKRKLAYDLYYIKNRSIFLDVKIALRTIQTVLSRSGR